MRARCEAPVLLRDEEEARAFVAARCEAGAVHKLEAFLERLIEANAQQNLIARSTADSLWRRHVADSAQLLDHVSRGATPWLDLGSGAGFPGLVLAIIDQGREYLLVESRRLRIQWLEQMISDLGLQNCSVLAGDAGRLPALAAAVISARAFAPLPRLIQISARFSTNATEWVLPKGRSADQELAALPAALRSRFHVKQSLTDPDGRILVARGRLGAR